MRSCAWIRFCANYAKYSWNPFTHVVPTDINKYRVCRVKYEMIDEHRMMLLADIQGIHLPAVLQQTVVAFLFAYYSTTKKRSVYSADAVQRIPAGTILAQHEWF